ncbi:PKD domain-containing protein [Saccharothrix sp. DSM 118769]
MAVAALLGLLVPGVAQAAPPANDDFDQATPITALPFSAEQSVTDATFAADDPYGCGYDDTVWFAYTPAEDGHVTASTAGDYDTVLGAYTGTRGSLSQVACNDDSGGTTRSVVNLSVRAGTTYHFAVASYSSHDGTALTFTVVPGEVPANDDFADATPVPALPFEVAADTTFAGPEPGEPGGGCGTPGKSVWYRLAVAETGSVSISGTSYYGTLSAFTGTSPTDLAEVRCTYGSGPLTFRAAAGTTYHVRLGDAGPSRLRFATAQPVRADFGYSPSAPSTASHVNFYDQSSDPANGGQLTHHWDFGDGTTHSGYYAQHRYAADGDYTATLTVTTADGRTDSESKAVGVRTHDVFISRFTTPGSGVVGRAKPITVQVRNGRYDEQVTVVLERSTPDGWVEFGRATQYVPATRAADFPFHYAFQPGDGTLGKVTFRAVANLGANSDALPLDNEAISAATTVQPAGATGRDLR